MQSKTVKITDPKVTVVMPHKYLGVFGMIWISILLTVILTGAKPFLLFGATVSAGIIAYPLTYIFSDIFTEVYGYRVSRRIVWTGFACIFSMSIFAYCLTYMPAPSIFTENEAFNTIFRSSPIISFIAVLAFWSGEFVNSFIVAKMKIFTEGRGEYLRYVASTFFGLTVDSLVFFWGAHIMLGWFAGPEIWYTTLISVSFCVIWETLALPVTNMVVDFIKEKEGIDTYDRGTKFNPFSLRS